jgi:hypothetical protein
MLRTILSCSSRLFVVLLATITITNSFAQNPIVTENALTGNPKSEWDISGAGSSTLQGFATDISVNKGSRINFKIRTSTVFTYGIKIYRLGYYQGNGARLITTLPNVTGTVQPAPISNGTTGIVDCGNWSISSFWDVPSTAVSGVYIAKLTHTSNSSVTSHIVFIVRDDASTSDVFFQTADATWQAYNNYGGNSLYVGATSYPGGHATKVSYNRPFNTRAGGGGGGAMEDWLFNAEYPMIRFLERNGYNVSYTTCVDADRRGNLITNHKIYLSVGHDEYWSAGQRANVEAARNAGVHLAFFSGNEVYWKTRWENSVDGSNTPYRTLVCYKEGTMGENVCGSKCDPTTAWTGLWRAGCEAPGGGACAPENALTGTISWGEGTTAITVPVAYKNLRFWRNTSVANLSSGQATFTAGTLGYEYDFEQYPGSYPSGRITLSSTTIGSNVHKLSLYRHPSGALVFGAGTIQWSWGLDNVHDRGSATPSTAMQQAMINLFADMGNVQPGSIMSGLSLATQSTDLTAPNCIISSPAHGATVQTGTAVTISGTASEVGGGQLVGVEVSVDGGTTWQAATGTANWTFSWTPTTAGSANIRVRGFDDSGNMGVPGASGSSSNITVTVNGSNVGAANVFLPSATPAVTNANDGSGLAMGMKFRSSEAGYITGVRYYKGAGSTGVRTGTLWSSSGSKLAEVAFTGGTASGWQQMMFTTPYQITANTTYVIAVHSASGDYVYTNPYFTSAVVNGTLRGLANGEDGPNGMYLYSSTPAFPTNNYQTSNYFVDVVYATSIAPDETPPTIQSVLPLNAATNVSVGTTVTATFSENIAPASVTTTSFQLRNNATMAYVTATVSTSGSQITLTPSSALAGSTSYTGIITGGSAGVKDVAGNALAGNYTWSFTTGVVDVTAPTVQSVSPLNNATGVATNTTVTATFSESVNPSTVTTTTFQLRNPSNVVIAATVSTSGSQITLTPSAALASGTTYTVTITGGASGVKDLAGNALAANYSWSFTTSTPSTIFQPTDTYSGTVYNEGTGLSLGMKFRSTQAGYITGVRYFKGAGTTGTHTGTLWSSTGSKLAEAIFINESSSGWQQVLFSQPYQITANTTYIISYHTPSGQYVATNPFFTSAVVNGPLRALATGEDGPNGIYVYGSTPVFPTNNYQSSHYWVDIVFATSVGPDVTPPQVQSTSPTNLAVGVGINTLVTANFNESINPATVTASSFELRNSSNALVPATVSASGNVATLSTSASLNYSATYTATIKGGSSGVKDVAGNALANDYTWSFTTTDPAAAPPTDGPGGPILVISTTTNPFSRYAVEMLRAEGLNEFAAKDLTQVTAGDLNNYDVVVLGEMSLTSAQTTMFTNWVNAGGTLIAFKPSTQLSSLLGITKVTGSLSDAYLLVNTASGPGVGIVNQTIQFHGTSDLYTLNGATSLATLYSNATTATTNPAVTLRVVGSNGGRAVAFTYDLARSIVYTRQGNPAWAGQERDGQPGPIRSDDLFFGGSEPDYVDFNKIAIPQADEQQRLLTNIILQSNLHRKPLPRFWFLPSGHKAAIVMTGDDHRFNGTTGQFDWFKTQGPNTAQDVLDWKAIRGTSYIYNGTLENSAAVAYQNDGFEIALHVNTNCQNFTASSFQTNITDQKNLFTSQLPGVNTPATNRTHCIAWSDWASAAKVQAQNGIRLDVNYYYWPASWVLNRPGMFTGSGMPMRFADIDGTLIDCYQVTTQMPDEAGLSYTSFTNALLDKAQGPEGYYGVFCTNMHTDSSVHIGARAIVASAIAHQVPVVSAKQMLTWLDGRNNSYFSGFNWNGGVLTFNITALTAARNLRAMLPINSESGPLASLKIDGANLSYTTQTIKGIQYAFFNVSAGTHTYVATYTVPNVAPSVTTHPSTQAICAGSNVTFTSAATGTPSPTVQWQVNNGSWTNIAGATNASYTFTPVIGDNGKQYRAVWTNSQGTANSNAATLTVNAIPGTPTVSVTNNCGNSVLTAGNFTGSLLWSTGATTTSITVTTSGNYTVTQTVNGCTSAAGSGTAAPLVSATPAPTVSVVNNCGNSVLTAGNVVGSLLWSTGATTTSITVTTGGTYTVTQTVSGCTSPVGSGVAAPKAIPATPTINASGSATLCQGGSVTLTASSASNNVWSTGATTQSIVVNATGNYSVTTTGASGCSATSGITAVTVNPLPAGTISSPTGTACNDGTASIVFNASAGTGPYSLVINGSTYNNVTSGNNVTVNINSFNSSLWDNTFVPATTNGNDGQPLEVGVKFRASVNGVIKSIKFYKGSNADGTAYTLKLYQNSNQALLSSQAFSNTTAQGWQVIDLPSPISVTAGTTYVASCYSAAGNYNYTDNYFTSARVSGSLTGLANGTDGVNGLYRYGAGGGFPSSGYQSSNYWVDVVFVPSTVSVNLTSITDSKGCTVTGSLGTLNLPVINCSALTRGPVATQTVQSQTTEIAGAKDATPSKLTLGQNHPNPFGSTTLVDFQLPKRERVRLSLYDGNGRLVKVLLEETRDAGSYVIPVRRNNLSAGIYYYRLEAGGEALVKKMTIW